MKKIYVAVLSMGYIRCELAPILHTMKNDPRFEVRIETHGLKPASHNRNNSVKEFLKTDCDYFLTIDHDNVPVRNPLDLVLLNKDIIGCPSPQNKETDLMWLVLRRVKDGYQQVPVEERSGLREVDAVGSGVMLIARRVLENVKAPFERQWDEDGLQTLGLDFYFCQKAKELGFKVWAHWDYPARHFKELDLIWVLDLLTRNK